MKLVVDTGIFSAALSRRRRARFETHVQRMAGQQIFLASVTVRELRYGALVAQWGEPRRQRLEASIQTTTVVPSATDCSVPLPSSATSVGSPVIPSTPAATPTISGSPPQPSTSTPRSSLPTACSRTPLGSPSTSRNCGSGPLGVPKRADKLPPNAVRATSRRTLRARSVPVGRERSRHFGDVVDGYRFAG